MSATITNYYAANRRVDEDPALAAHRDTIFYDWPNWDEHLEWLLITTTAEIVDWAETVEAQEGEIE